MLSYNMTLRISFDLIVKSVLESAIQAKLIAGSHCKFEVHSNLRFSQETRFLCYVNLLKIAYLLYTFFDALTLGNGRLALSYLLTIGDFGFFLRLG